MVAFAAGTRIDEAKGLCTAWMSHHDRGRAGQLRPAVGEQISGPPQPAMLPPSADRRAADFDLQIAPMLVELAPNVVLSTIGYSNQVPGPLLRMREGSTSPSTLRTRMGCSRICALA